MPRRQRWGSFVLAVLVAAQSLTWATAFNPGRVVIADAAEMAPPPVNVGSLLLSGTDAAAEVVSTPELNIGSDWTIETWIRDDDPAGFDHPFRYVLDKGDGVAAESPYYVLVGNGSLLVGLRTAGVNHPLTYNLHFAGYSSAVWQHVAASFSAASTTLTVYLNGV